MFDFKNGMLGVVIIALAIAGALFGSYLAGIETEQVEVTKYDYLADVSGLFEYDQSPQYIEFDPSTNYTGYYSDESYNSMLDKNFFAEDQVDYNPSSNVNNYKLYLPIVDGDSDRLELTTSDVDEPFTYTTYIGLSTIYEAAYSTVCDTVYLKSWMEANHLLDGDENLFYFRSIGEYEELDTPAFGVEDVDWVIFSTVSSWVRTGAQASGYNMYLNVASQDKFAEAGLKDGDEYNGYKVYRTYHSCIVDTVLNTVTLCYDSFCEEPSSSTTTDLSSVLVSFNGRSDFSMSDELDMDSYTQNFAYLDPNEGVWLKD